MLAVSEILGMREGERLVVKSELFLLEAIIGFCKMRLSNECGVRHKSGKCSKGKQPKK